MADAAPFTVGGDDLNIVTARREAVGACNDSGSVNAVVVRQQNSHSRLLEENDAQQEEYDWVHDRLDDAQGEQENEDEKTVPFEPEVLFHP
jgi:hypothetical protein